MGKKRASPDLLAKGGEKSAATLRPRGAASTPSPTHGKRQKTVQQGKKGEGETTHKQKEKNGDPILASVEERHSIITIGHEKGEG